MTSREHEDHLVKLRDKVRNQILDLEVQIDDIIEELIHVRAERMMHSWLRHQEQMRHEASTDVE